MESDRWIIGVILPRNQGSMDRKSGVLESLLLAPGRNILSVSMRRLHVNRRWQVLEKAWLVPTTHIVWTNARCAVLLKSK